MRSHTVMPARRVEGSIMVPGDKSISHRALMIASVATGRCRIHNPSAGDDVRATLTALRQLAVAISNHESLLDPQVEGDGESGSQILVEGRGLAGLVAPEAVLECANSGTTARTLLGILAGRPFQASLDGDDSLRRRPMDRVVEPLSRMGAVFDGNQLPLKIRGGRLHGIAYELPVASAQVKTAIILAGLQAEGETTVVEPSASRDHTERMLAYLGNPITKELNRLIVKPTELQNASEIRIPGDISSAAFLLVAAAVLPGSAIEIRDVGVNETRTGVLDVLARYGAEVSITDKVEICGEPHATVRVRAADRRALEIGGPAVPALIDELPLVAVLGAFAEGETVVTGAGELRVKESDRIQAIVDGMRALGAEADALPDGFVVRGGRPLSGATVDARGDHRIGMALAVAGLAAGAGETIVQGWEAVPVSYPGFERDLGRVVIR